MFAFLHRLRGKYAEEAVEQRNVHLTALEQQGQKLDQLLKKLEVATSAANARTDANVEERDRLRTSNSGQLRLRLDSTTNER